MAFEEPKYQVVEQLESIEVRNDDEYWVAEAEVMGDRSEAGSLGFKLLAAYIFGKNLGNHNISMTAPVIQTEQIPLELGTPLITKNHKGSDRNWTIQFPMPSKFTVDTLPKPKDSRVHLKLIPRKKFAVVTYSGRWTEANYDENLEVLKTAMEKRKLKSVGEPFWARYNAPYTLWFLRKNEILIQIN